jgi:lysophospholipase L1-like esterase
VNDIDTGYDNSVVLFKSADYLRERCANRKLLIYGTGTDAAKLSQMLLEFKYNVDYYLSENDGETFQDQPVRSPFDIVYEDPERIFIIVAIALERYSSVRHTLLDLGLFEFIHFTYFKDVPLLTVPYLYDPVLTVNRVKERLEGFEVFGDTDNPDATVIVALGGSTTESELHFIKGWVCYLSDYLKADGIPALIYCGGVANYTSTQELLKLIRDVIPLQPDIVISYSGYNDLAYHPLPQPPPFNSGKKTGPFAFQTERAHKPFIHYIQVDFFRYVTPTLREGSNFAYYGLPNDKPASVYWLDNIRMMNAIAKEFGITFLSFFQPFAFVGNYEITESQKIIFERYWWKDLNSNLDPTTQERVESMIRGAGEIIASISKYDFITDISHIFEGCKNIYIDDCHVTEQGNEIIATNIYAKLKEVLRDAGRTY